MKITTEMVDYISELSRLSLPEEEKAAMTFINSWRDAVCLPDLCLIA